MIEVGQLTGMPAEKVCSPEAVISKIYEISDEELGLQVVSEEVTTNKVSLQDVTEEVIVEDNVSILGQKRKCSDDSEIDENDIFSEVSRTLKRPRMTSSSEKSAHDHTYCIKSPRRLKTQVYGLVDKIENLQKKVKISQQKTRRRNRKVSTLASVVSELKEKNLINSDCATLLETTFSGVPKELMKRLVTQKKKKNPGAYPLELRSFAMTLKFYSTKAYNYVRKSFNLGLPNPTVIRSWYSSMNGEPGFTKNALAALKAKVLAAKRDNQEVVCALMLDEMSIRVV